MPLRFGRKYWWAFGVTDQGRNSLLGPYDSEGEASSAASRFNKVRVFPLGTSDRGKAGQMVRAALLRHKTQPPDQVLKPMQRRIMPHGFNRAREESEGIGQSEDPDKIFGEV